MLTPQVLLITMLVLLLCAAGQPRRSMRRTLAYRLYVKRNAIRIYLGGCGMVATGFLLLVVLQMGRIVFMLFGLSSCTESGKTDFQEMREDWAEAMDAARSLAASAKTIFS